MTAWSLTSPLLLELGVLATALLVFTADLLLGVGERRGLGALTAIGLTTVLGLSFFLDIAGPSWGGAYVADGFGLYLKQALLLAGIIGALGSVDHVDEHFPERQGEHYLLLLFSLTGLMLLTGARDLLLWVVAFELAGVPLYALAALRKAGTGPEAALKLYLTGAVSSAITIYGVSLVWGIAGTTSFAGLSLTAGEPLFIVGMLTVLGGVGFKLGAVPFHLWMADTYEGAPAPTVALMSVAPKIAAFGALVRLYPVGLDAFQHIWAPMIVALAVLGMVVGNLAALAQTDARRLLALSGVGHVGLMLLALGAGTPETLGMLAFYAPAYVVTNMGAFLVVGAVVEEGGGDIRAFAGLSQRNPALGLAMLLFLLSLAGIPFVVGFWAKVLLLWAAWKAGLAALVVLGAILSVVGLFYYLKLGRSIYVEEPAVPGPLALGANTKLALILCTVGVVGMGLWPKPFVEAALTAARSLL